MSEPAANPVPRWLDRELAVPGFEFDGGGQARSRGRYRDPWPFDSCAPANPGGSILTASLFDSPWRGLPLESAARGSARARHAKQARWPLLVSFRRRHAEATDSMRGWVLTATVIVALIATGVGVSIGVSANKRHAQAQTQVAPSPDFVPATIASQDFTPYAASSSRGITQSEARLAGSGTEIVATAAQTGQRVPRAQFFVSLNDGRSWALGSLTAAGGGTPPPGHAAQFVAGGAGKWAAIGPDSVWTSTNGQAWTLASTAGLPQQAGDRVMVLKRTSSGFLAAGKNVPDADQAKETPVIFLSANGTDWHRLGPGQLRLAAGNGRALDIRLAATDGNLILIAGDIAAPAITGTGTSRHLVTVRIGGAWLSDDDGKSWTQVSVPTGHGAQPEFSDAAATADGLLLVRPAVADGVPVADVYRSGNGTAWTFVATLTASGGFVPGLMNGGPAGAVLAGQSGQQLIAFVSANGISWRQVPAFGSATAEAVSGVAVTDAGAVVAAGSSAAVPGSSQQLITVTGATSDARRLNVAAIPGAVEPQLAVNAVAAQGRTQVAVGSANGFPAAWISSNGGATWHRGTGQTPAVLDRPGIQQLISVAHGSAGWLAVGDVAAEAASHPVVLVSADGSVWSAGDGESVFAAQGLSTAQAAAGRSGYVIVGDQIAVTADRGRARSTRMIAAAWWSTRLTGWQRAGDAVTGALDGTGSRQMLAVTATAVGFVAVGSHNASPAVWTTTDGRTWTEAGLRVPADATGAVLTHVVADGRAVVATGVAQTATGQVPFAARSANGGTTWSESDLPVPAGAAQVTALAAANGLFIATGSFGTTPGQQNVVVWTSRDGATWKAATPTGRGLAGPGIQAITGLTASGNMVTGVGFTASPASEQPILWRFLIRLDPRHVRRPRIDAARRPVPMAFGRHRPAMTWPDPRAGCPDRAAIRSSRRPRGRRGRSRRRSAGSPAANGRAAEPRPGGRRW
jgi:hypothetical protein